MEKVWVIGFWKENREVWLRDALVIKVSPKRVDLEPPSHPLFVK